MVVNIIDVELGNIRSIEHWLDQCNLYSKRVSNITDFTEDVIIIPGVASAGEYMYRLKEAKLDKEIIRRSENRQKIIGICLGFQILTNYSEEDSGVKCLGLLNGVTKYMNNIKTHNGWSSFEMDTRKINKKVKIPKKRKKKVKGRVFFNHELVVDLDCSQAYINILENKIMSFAFKDNIFGFQFHPEKSQETGRDILRLLI